MSGLIPLIGKVIGMGGDSSADPTTAGGSTALGLGAVQGIAGLIKRKKADSLLPAMEDPEQRAMLRYVSRRRRSFETGTANNMDRAAMRQAMQSGISNSFKFGAGSRGLNAMNKMYTQGIMNLNQQSQGTANALIAQESKMLDDIAQRKLDLGMTKYDTQQARAAEMLKSANNNLGAGLAKVMNLNYNPTTGKTN
jgi:hypothetical protein